MTRSKKNYVAVFLILTLYFVFLFNKLGQSPWETTLSWRQSDTFSVAKIYYDQGINLLKPQFLYDGANKNIVQLELEVLPMLGVLIAKFSNLDLVFSLRLVSLIFFLGSALFLYLISKLFVDDLTALFSLFLYLSTPLSIIISRNIMPESLALFFYLGGLYFILSWKKFDLKRNLYFSAIFISLAILQKIPVMFIGLAILFYFVKKMGWRAFKSLDFYLYGVISLLPPMVYYIYIGKIATLKFVGRIAEKHIMKSNISYLLSSGVLKYHWEILSEYFGLILLVTAFIGLIIALFDKNDRECLLPWFISMLLEILTICAIIKFEYYYVFFIPILVILASLTIAKFLKLRVLKYLIFILIIPLTFQAVETKKEYLCLDYEMDKNIKAIKREIDKNTPIGINTLSPTSINGVGVEGTRIGLDYYEEVPKDKKNELLYWSNKGIKNFILIKSEESTEGFKAELDKIGEIIYTDDKLIIYRIKWW